MITSPTECVKTDTRQNVSPCPFNCPCRCKNKCLFNIRFVALCPSTESDFVVGLRNRVCEQEWIFCEMRVPRHTYTKHHNKRNKEEPQPFHRGGQYLSIPPLRKQIINCESRANNTKDYRGEGTRIERVSQRKS